MTLSLDECILQVFEEQQDTFFFPLTSQKTARGFVKALHSKGLAFEDIGKEIDEFEHNFSAWRKGLGRVGIGKRMLTRINQPLQDLLDSDDEDDTNYLNNHIANLKKTNGAPHRGINGNNNTATATQNGSNSTPLHKLDRDSAKEKSRDLTEAWTKNIEDKMARIEKDRERDQEAERKKSEDTSDSSSRSTRESTPKRETKEQRELSESAKVFERIRGKKPGQDEEQPKEEQTVTKEVVTRTQSKPEEKTEKRKEVVTRTKSKPDEETEKRKSVKDLVANKESSSTPASPQHSGSDSKGDETREERLNRLQEKIAMLKQRFPKGENGEKKDSSDSSNQGTPSPTPKSPLAERKSSPIAERRASPKPRSPLVSRSSSRSDSPAVSSPKHVSNSSAEENHRISLKQVADVTENYDSDLDIDALPEEEVTFEAKNLVAKLRSLKHSQQDGPGYLYIFGTEDGTQFKVGESRFPSARLEQAQLFNPSLEMLLSVSVGKRREGLRRAGAALESCAMPGTVHWYAGDKQAAIDTVMQVADALPAEDTSIC